MARNQPEIIFENDELVALNKPSGMLTIPDREQAHSLKDILLQKYGSVFTIHRLDRDTSGLVLFAKNEASHKYYSSQFEKRDIEKYYSAIVMGQPPHDNGEMTGPIMEHPAHKGMMIVRRNGKASHTSYKILEKHRSYSLVEFRLHTGRTHQIRVHAKDAGFPIACDPLYGDGLPVKLSTVKKKFKLAKSEEEERPILNRLALHAHRLVFNDEAGKHLELTANLPKEFTALMRQVSKWEK